MDTKESYAKADGRGLAFPFRRYSTSAKQARERSPSQAATGQSSFELPLDLGDRHGFTADIPGWRFFEAQLGDAII